MTVTVPLIIALLKYKQLGAEYLLLFYYLLVSFFTNAAAITLAESGVNNLPLLHLFTLVEGVLLLFFYQKNLTHVLNKYLFLLLAALFVVFCLINSLFIQALYTFNTYSRSAEAVLIIFLALTCFYTSLGENNRENWNKQPLILINIGLLLYFSSSLLLFLFSQVLLANQEINIIVWVIHATIVMIMYFFFAWAFLQYKKTAS
ncbi:MAG: hypothetical protein KGZ74_05080 [Chitinophagaceae bacterium]|nr:hypothetical protein [Chitinophagaceae bacterium]